MQKCKQCGEVKPFSCFPRSKARKSGHLYVCKECTRESKARDYKAKWFKYQTRLKKSECKRRGVSFNLTEEYLESIWTGVCPVYNVPLVRGDKTHPHQAALDRIDPNKGYIQGNVVYISSRANRIKYDATSEELRLIADFIESATTIPKGSTLK